MIETLENPIQIIKRLLRLTVLGSALALAGCVTADNPLSQNDVENLKLTSVVVSFAPKALVMGEDGPRDILEGKIRAGVEQAMAGQLVGARPARLEIVVSRFRVPSAGSSILIGSNPEMFASAALVDARTGAVIIVNPEVQAALVGGHGVIGFAVQAAIDNSANQTPESRLIAEFGRAYRAWLTRGA